MTFLRKQPEKILGLYLVFFLGLWYTRKKTNEVFL